MHFNSLRRMTFDARRLMLVILGGFMLSCNSVFYQPLREDLYDPSQLNLKFSREQIPSEDGVVLAAFWFRPLSEVKFKKLIIHFHGNAENMSSHFMFTAWLTRDGFDVLTFDYRGYGRSSDQSPTRLGLVQDGCGVLRWIAQHKVLHDFELYVLGQSLGGAVAVSTLAHCPQPGVKGLIIDSSFSSYRRIARQKLGSIFLTWPLQIPLSFLVTDEWSPVDYLASLQMRKIFFHNSEDPVVPYELGKELFEQATAPKTWVDVTWKGHTTAFASEGPYREELVKFLLQ